MTQAERSARSRAALLESAARNLSQHGYGNLALERVAADAGYTRGALYHHFKDKQDLAMAVIEWAHATWVREVGPSVAGEAGPVAALLALARGHAVFCRRDVARMAIALRMEFSGKDHPVGREVEEKYQLLVGRCADLIEAARSTGSIPAGPRPEVLAQAVIGALEGTVIAVAGQAQYDELLAARAVAGVLGIPASKALQGEDENEAPEHRTHVTALANSRSGA
ncbi:TetR/AcrR family transcriptional regulator [Pseudofrankia sp. BMG5.36]|uniref:TetR/AcrR family transcriptional regulator n=1 Tax=Pseudofrankia sp. BMG5.36 TaxID=1834512 RepID=UPI0008DB04FE|nr:TetR/AcrR family transcriptional regulator [Pseudofrankia sp. BMG5.36]OHV44813.1 TetR family transcriptional regulator [Pseudofrankia sp. BMG5.36]